MDYEAQAKAARAALERDRTEVARCITEIIEIIGGYRWATEGMGPYEWDDDRYREEFGHALDGITRALGPLKKIGWDMTNCPTTQEEVMAARKGLL